MSDPPDKPSSQEPARYGPFHRVESPSQSIDDARLQAQTGEVWGRTPRGGSWPKVQAYRGELPAGTRGIEFWTDVMPDADGSPSLVSWSGRGINPGVWVEGEFAKIQCVITKNTQVSQ